MRKDIQRLREQYPKGSRVELLESVTDPYHPLPAGSKGSVWAVDDAGQLHINWDEGGSLALIYGIDSFRKIGGLEEHAAQPAMEEGLSFVK